MKPLRLMVVDDEPACRDGMGYLINEREDMEVVAMCSNGAEAIDAIQKLRPDLVMLDIQMPEIDGFQVLCALDPNLVPAIIFVTAYDQYAVKAFEAHALDYLLKPYTAQRLHKVLDRAASVIGKEKALESLSNLNNLANSLRSQMVEPAQPETYATRLMVEHSSGLQFVSVQDILWIEGSDYYVTLHLEDGRKPLLKESLKSLCQKLDPSQFARVHKSAVIRIDKILEINKDNEVVLQNGVRTPLSRRRKRELLNNPAFRYGMG